MMIKNILLIVCILFLSGCCCCTKPETTSYTPPPPVNNPVTTKKNTPVIKQTEFQLNQPFSVDDIRYSFTRVDSKTAIGTNQYTKETASPGATFIIVYYTVENLSKETKTVLTSSFYLYDSKSRKFTSSSKGSTALSAENKGMDFLLSQLQPGVAKNSAIVYEIPLEARDLKIEISGGFFGGDKYYVKI